MEFQIKAPFEPAGDQPAAIAKLADGIEKGLHTQVLLGATGTGKTYTIAQVINKVRKPTLVIAHNKTLAAQLASELKAFFPENAVEYFVSYYDYYQPEAYIPQSDTYIEKDASINDEIDKLRHSATSALFERRDVIIVASVSCIYGLGAPQDYYDMVLSLRLGQTIDRQKILQKLVEIQYNRNDIDFKRGTFRVRGDVIEVIPAAYGEKAVRIEMFDDEVDRILEIDVLTGEVLAKRNHVAIFPASHYVTSRENMERAMEDIKVELKDRLEYLNHNFKVLEAQRLEQRTNYDLEMMNEMGYCSGIENYSRHLAGRKAGEMPFTLVNYFPKDFLLVVDESHVTLPQVRAMYAGDRSRKEMLVEHGFRLPSAYDNRPLTFDEFQGQINQAIYVSATPAQYELEQAEQVVEQIIRPTGLLDPGIEIRPIKGQIDDLLGEINKVADAGERVLVTTLTKRMSEDLTEYLKQAGVRVRYLHSEIATIERAQIIDELRAGKFDVLVGINLLREGLDLPEVSLIAILDADKEGFLRSDTAMIQTIGRAARNAHGRVIMYADRITDSMRRAIDETNRRREKQEAYNKEHGITPKTIYKEQRQLIKLTKVAEEDESGLYGKKPLKKRSNKELNALAKELEKRMQEAAKALDFEAAAELRDQLILVKGELGQKLMPKKEEIKVEKLIVKGARQHNLKNINVEIPRDKLVVITGLSGSGKSSLAFDTIYAEGQRRYVESLSAYARQFLGQMDKPDVDYIEGLSPAISIDQKTTSRNPRSTVGTVTEIYDYLRLLFARVGEPHCPQCGKLIEQQSVQQIVDAVLALEEGTRFMVMAPLVRGRKGEHQRVLDEMRRGGYVRMYIDGEIRTLDEEISLEKNKKHSLAVVIDRLAVREGIHQRLADSVETALKLADGFVEIAKLGDTTEIELYSEHFACNDCGISLPAIEPRLFSFNNPYGACPVCTGLGMNMEFDKGLIIPDGSKTFRERALAAFSNNLNSYFMKQLGAVLASFGYDYDTAWDALPPKVQDFIWNGDGETKFRFLYENLQGEVKEHSVVFEGVLNTLKRRYREAFSDAMRQDMEEFMVSKPCPECHGHRLKPEVLSILVGGKNICQVTALTVRDCMDFFAKLELTERQKLIARQILKEIGARLQFLNDVGLDYLTLDRSAGTLSGGEAQRIRLATQIGSGLTGVLYILDEPSIGLHQRDNGKLLETLKHLRDLGNTLLVVEHDEETMYAADQIIDIGPGAGEHGGQVVAQGTVEEIKLVEASVTGTYLSGRKFIPVPKHRRHCDGRYITIRGARANNLKNIDVEIPLGVFTVVTGVSGSGKSTLINDILYNALGSKLNGARLRPAEHDAIEGIEQTDKVINIDQSPIGRTPRSNPATYTGVFDFIRELFSQTNEAKMRGYKAGRFSFNVKGGRCEACKGDGMNKIEMNFLPDVYVPCEVCHGARYNRDTLEIHYKGKTIAQVLDMTVSEACEFFKNQPRIFRKLEVLEDVGLGYIHLGQAATTLSGGEAQRVKLATELSRRSTGRTVYILDEPTTGLHIADVHKLLEVLQRLVESGDSVIVIEHNLDVIKTADYLIDLGPEGGDKGGTLVACGTPEEVAKVKKSYTGQYVKAELAKAKKNGWYV